MDILSLGAGAAGGLLLSRLLRRTREHEETSHGLSDLLLWDSAPRGGVVAMRDGALLAGWTYHGPDLASATAGERTALSHQLTEALSALGSGWMLHADAVRRPARPYAATGAFPDPVTRLIEEERRRAYEGSAYEGSAYEGSAYDGSAGRGRPGGPTSGAYPGDGSGGRFYETDYVLTATYLPPTDLYGRLSSLFVTGGRGRVDGALKRLTEDFEEALRALERRIGPALALERLSTEGLLTHLHGCLTGDWHPVRDPGPGYSLNAYLSDRPFWGGFAPRIGDLHVRVVAAHGFPGATRQGMLDALHNLEGAYRWSSRVIMLARQDAAGRIRDRRQSWFNKYRSLGSLVASLSGSTKSESARQTEEAFFKDRAARRLAEDAAEALSRAETGGERFALYSSNVVVTRPSPDDADEAAAQVAKVFQEAGLPARVEDVNAVAAFLGSLPGHGAYNKRRPILRVQNVADLLPATKIWAGSATCPSPLFPAKSPALVWTATGGATPFRVNLHAEGDVGHTLVVGKTGAGKSVLLNTLIAQWRRYPGAQVFLFDVGYSGWMLARAAGGQHFSLEASPNDGSPHDGNPHEGNPGDGTPHEGTPDGGSEAVGSARLRLQPLRRVDDPGERAWAAGWVEALVQMQNQRVTPEQRLEIGRALLLLGRGAPSLRTLSNLKVQVQDEAVAAALAPFASGGVYEHLLDGTEGGAKEGPEGDASYQVYELSQVRDLGQEAFLPLLLALFRRVERRLRADRPTLIVLEEVWSVLMEERFAARVKEWLLTLRKQNAAVVLAAHSPSQIAELPSRDLVVESCPTRIFLPNPDALEPSTLELYRSMGLRRREVEIIASATQKRDYYFSSRVGARLFDLGLGPLALEFVAGGKESREGRRRRVREMEGKHGPGWPRAWLEEAGLSEWAALYDDARRAAQSVRDARLSGDARSAGDDAPSSELATKGGSSRGEGAGALSDTNGKWAGSTSAGPEDASS